MKTKWILNYGALLLVIFFFACSEKYEGNNSIENVKYNSNKTTYAPMEIDSVNARNYIIKLKLQEVYDLATNYAAGNKDTEIDQTLYNQLKEYFEKPDSTIIEPLIKEMDSLSARYVKIVKVSSDKEIIDQDTLDFADYSMLYYNKDKRYIGSLPKKVQYVLKETPVPQKKFNSEFKFYFVSFAPFPSLNDSISSGEIR